MYDHYIFHYITGGSGTYYCNDCAYPLAAGDMFLIQPQQSVSYHASQEDPYRYLWVGFQGYEAPRLISLCGFDSGRPVLSLGLADEITVIMQRIAAVQYADPATACEIVGLFYQLVAEIMRHSQVHTQTKQYQYVYSAISYMRENLADPALSVDSIARNTGVDRTWLFRQFQKTQGCSVQQMLISMRMEKAQELLAATDSAISAVSQQCGFSDQAYFSASFKRWTGVSPSQWRRQEWDAEMG